MPGRGKRIVDMTMTELWTFLLGSLVISVVLLLNTFRYQEWWSWLMLALCIFFWLLDLLTIREIWTRMRKSGGGGV
jgi:hypothetical protein